MSWEPGPTAAECCADSLAVLLDKVDVTNDMLDKILTLLKALYEART